MEDKQKKAEPRKTEAQPQKTETATAPAQKKSSALRSVEFAEDGSNYADVLALVQYVDPTATARRDEYANVASIVTQSGPIRRGDKVSMHKGRELRVERKKK